MEEDTTQTETKVSIILALVMVVTALFDLRLATGLAIVYLIVYAIRRMRKRRSN